MKYRKIERSLGVLGTFSGSSLLMDKDAVGDRTWNCVVDCGMIPVTPPKKKRFELCDYDKELYKQCNEGERFSKIEAFSAC